MAAPAADGADAPGASVRRARDPALQPRRRRDHRLDLGEGRRARLRRLRPGPRYRADSTGITWIFSFSC